MQVQSQKKTTLKELQDRYSKLKKICLDYDPFLPESLNQETESLMEEFQLNDLKHDPLIFTNALLLLLDQTEIELKKREKTNHLFNSQSETKEYSL